MSLVRFRLWALVPYKYYICGVCKVFYLYIFRRIMAYFNQRFYYHGTAQKARYPMDKISMSKKSNLTIQEAFDLLSRKCRIKNLTDLSISSYEKKMVHFYEFIDKNESIKTVIKDTVDDYILWLCENTEANDTTINSYLRSLRAFLYYCMECNYSSFSCCCKTKRRRQLIILLSHTLA